MIHFYIATAIAFIIGYFLLKYLSGDFTVLHEEIIEKGDIKSYYYGTTTGQYYITKRTYESGKIKIFRTEF